MTNLTRKITFIPAYDRSKETPNYGIHGLVIGFELHGPEGVINWNFHSGIYLEHNRGGHQSVYGNEICAHSSKPFEGSDGPQIDCGLLGGIACHSKVLTGAIYGQELGEKLVSSGDSPIWTELERYYNELFHQLELKGLINAEV